MSTTYMVSARPLEVFLGTCETCLRPVRYPGSRVTGDRKTFPCIDCGTPVRCERLYGTVNRMQCDPRCEGATGPVCSCGCGGINHGGAWSRPGHMLASELEAYRAEIAKREAQRQVKVTRERRHRADEFSVWQQEHGQLVTDLLGTDWLEGRYPNEFLADMAGMLRGGKMLSGRQAEAAERTIQRRKDAAAKAAEREVTAVDVPEGRIKVTGIIVATYSVPDNYSHYEHDIYKMVIDTGTYRVRGTIPRSLDTEPDEHGASRFIAPADLKGRTVSLTATLSPDGKEKGSGYFKRPSGAVFAAGS